MNQLKGEYMIKTTLLLLALLAGTASAQTNWGLPELPTVNDYLNTQPVYTQPSYSTPSWSLQSPDYSPGARSVWEIEQDRQRAIDANTRSMQPNTQFQECSRPSGVMSSYYRRCMGHY